MAKILALLIILLTLAHVTFATGKINVTVNNRGFVQQKYANDFLKSRDSLYFIKYKVYEPFTSKVSVDSFMCQFERSWRNSAASSDSNCLRIDSYVYSLILRSKHGEEQFEGYVWKEYMLPSFYSDVAFCNTVPESKNANILWPGNAVAIFAYAYTHDLSREEWHRLSTIYFKMPELIGKYLMLKEELDSNQEKRLLSTKKDVDEYREFFTVMDAVHAERLDEAFTLLATEYIVHKKIMKGMSPPLRKLVYRYSELGQSDRALAILDIATRFTNESDLERDSLRSWYHSIDSVGGIERMEKISREYFSPILVSSGKHITLSGVFRDLVTGKLVDLSTTKGKTVIVDFWTTWCGACKAEIPTINKLIKWLSTRNDIVFVAISSDADHGGASEAMVRLHAKNNNMKYTVIYDNASSSLTKAFGVNEFPQKFVINSAGELLNKPGAIEKVDLKTIELYLSKN